MVKEIELTQRLDSYTVVTRTEIHRRTWQERLLSWPWRPWQTFKNVTVVCHPSTAYRLRNELANLNDV